VQCSLSLPPSSALTISREGLFTITTREKLCVAKPAPECQQPQFVVPADRTCRAAFWPPPPLQSSLLAAGRLGVIVLHYLTQGGPWPKYLNTSIASLWEVKSKPKMAIQINNYPFFYLSGLIIASVSLYFCLASDPAWQEPDRAHYLE
jgi:hypothetical protein